MGTPLGCGRRKATWSDSVDVLFRLDSTTEFITEQSKKDADIKRRCLASDDKPGIIETGSGCLNVAELVCEVIP